MPGADAFLGKITPEALARLQPPVEGDGEAAGDGEVVDAVVEWGIMAKYGRPDPVQ